MSWFDKAVQIWQADDVAEAYEFLDSGAVGIQDLLERLPADQVNDAQEWWAEVEEAYDAIGAELYDEDSDWI